MRQREEAERRREEAEKTPCFRLRRNLAAYEMEEGRRIRRAAERAKAMENVESAGKVQGKGKNVSPQEVRMEKEKMRKEK